MAFGNVIRWADSFSGPRGIGGTNTVIWHCDGNTDRVYELSTTDFSVIRSASSPSTNPHGIGGDANTIWHCDVSSNRVYELSTTDFSVIRSAASPSISPTGIGGTNTVIWYNNINTDRVYELSTTDFSVIRSASSPSTNPYGIGGDANTIWHCDDNTDRVYELSTTDFSVIRSASSPSTNPHGIGGDANTIWHCDTHFDRIYELDADVSVTYFRTFSETLTLSDTITKKSIKTLSETFNITDTIQKGIRKALSETFNITDTIQKGIRKALSEVFTIIDNIITRLIKAKILSEILTITDTINSLKTIPFLSGYTIRRKITVDPTKVDANLTDFPTLVKLTSANFDFTKSNPDGHDIRFTAANGTTLLKYERERHDSVGLKAEYWVKIPSVSATAPTEFYIYYRTEDTADGANPTAVWDVNTMARWSLKENPAGTAPQMKDSTLNINHGTTHGAMTSAQSVEGKIGKALNFDGVDDYIDAGNNASLNITNAITIEAWIKIPASFTGWNGIIKKGKITADRPNNYLLQGEANGRRLQLAYSRIGHNNDWIISTKNLPLNKWTHIVAFFDRPNLKRGFYFNGESAGITAMVNEPLISNNYPLLIGVSEPPTLRAVQATIDEVRIYNRALSAAEIKASFHSGNDTLLTYGKLISKTFSEILTLLDTIVKKPIKTLSEVFTITDTIQKTIKKVLIEVLAITDTIQKIIGKIFSEAITITDIIKRNIGKVLSEIFTITDIIFIKKVIRRILSEAIAIADVIITRITKIKVFLDIITITDTIKKTVKKVLLEIIKIFDKIKLPVIWIKKGRPTITWIKKDK